MGRNKTKSSTPSDNLTKDRSGIYLLGAEHLRDLLSPSLCLAALEEMYANLHNSPADTGKSIGFETTDGKFHVKSGLSPRTHKYFAAKVNANYPKNQERFGLPTIQGLIVLSSAKDGRPLAIMDSGEITGIRTAAATALAARHGARDDSRKLAIVGCGAQAKYQIQAIMNVRSIDHIYVFDINEQSRSALAAWVSKKCQVKSSVAASIEDAVGSCDICVTATTSTRAFLAASMVPKGCFIGAVGADNPDKQEIDPDIFSSARILADDIAQCATSGDLSHAIEAGTASLEDVAANLAELAAGAAVGRTSEQEIVIFDSTGVGVQDVAAAAAAFETAINGRVDVPCLS